jgi:hypothetical protein
MKQEGYLEIKDEYEPIISEGGGGGISDGYYCISTDPV